MKIYRNENINLNFSQRSRFPRVSRKIIDKLWLDKRGKGGQEFLELALNLIGDYEFDKKYIKELDEYTFELKTTEGKTVRVELECGNMDDCPQIKVTEDNVQMSYDYTPISGYTK